MPVQERGATRVRVVSSHLLPSATSSKDAVTFVSLEEAAKMDGLRITQIPGLSGIYAECLKNLLDCKGVPFTRVIHPPMDGGDNQAFLYKLTAQKSFPTMLYNDERPRNSWLEQAALAEQLGTGPSLIPSDPRDRVLMWGLMHELLAEDGLVWAKRLLFGNHPLTKKYGWSEGAEAGAPRRILELLPLFTEQVQKQQKAGSKYVVGSSLSLLDIYLATVTYMFVPPGPDLLERTQENESLLAFFGANPPEVQRMLDNSPWLVEYRDFILKTHCVTPGVLGGTPL